MSVYVITWNLNNERQNYDSARRSFIQHLERYENTRDSGLESVRWISTSLTAEQVQNDLLTKLDANDRLFISKLTSGNYGGWLSREVWDWIKARL